MSEVRASIIMPAYEHASFIPRAIRSVLAQTVEDWELIIVDDGSRDGTADVVKPYLCDPRVRYERSPSNDGLGAALNRGLELAGAPLIAYLPADDVYHASHLASLLELLDERADAVLAYSGVRHHYNRTAAGAIEGYSLQLVQVLHRATADRWVERDELVTDDLGVMLWNALARQGAFAGTGRVTCEWVDHPGQLHKVVREPEGGINPYRSRFGVRHPLRFATSVGNRIDEVARYERFRSRPAPPLAEDALRILLVGELAYNAERVLALRERGHELYGLWIPDPHWYNTVGPLPFGHVTDLPRDGWREAVRRVKPDVIYALLNWQAVPFAHEVLTAQPGIPFVWHFKEGPFICLERGTWPQLLDLHTRSDGQVYSSPEMRDWFATFLPAERSGHELVLDGDLPKREWFTGARTPRLSDRDGELHTVVPGRPIGLHPPEVVELARSGVHLHFYGNLTQEHWRAWIAETARLAPRHLHLHDQVDQDRWVEEFSQYDAGWLHYFASENHGELGRANWDDLNYPARLATLAAAGLPVLQRDNTGHLVATQTLVRERDMGLFFSSMEELGERLRDTGRMGRLRDSVWRQRLDFAFDSHADRLVSFFRAVIAG